LTVVGRCSHTGRMNRSTRDARSGAVPANGSNMSPDMRHRSFVGINHFTKVDEVDRQTHVRDESPMPGVMVK
jgi:hypothetical protein